VHVVTRVDPVFMLLPLLSAAAECGEFLSPAALLRQQVSHDGSTGGGGGGGGGGSGSGSDGDVSSSAAARVHLGFADVGTVLSHHPRLADALASVCDVSDAEGTAPAQLAYRLDRGKAVGLLAERVRAVARQLAQKDVEAAARLKAAMGGFSAASAALPASAAVGEEGGGGDAEAEGPIVTVMHLYHGLSILSDSVADAWVAAVASRLE
jgi:hypothetical protein